MSLAALNWAIDLDLYPSSCKLVLLIFANYADENGVAYPSATTICAKTSLDRKTVGTSIKRLEEMGLLVDTGKKTGRTGQVSIFKIAALPTADKSHYVYQIVDPSTGNYYLGTRSCLGSVEHDVFTGSDRWSRSVLTAGGVLVRNVLSIHTTRQEAESAEIAMVRQRDQDPLCMNPEYAPGRGQFQSTAKLPKNGTVPILDTLPKLPKNGTVPKTDTLPDSKLPNNGTVPKTEQFQKRIPSTVQSYPFFPSKVSVFPIKGTQNWDTYTGSTHQLTVNKPVNPLGAQSAPLDAPEKETPVAKDKTFNPARIPLPEWLPPETWKAFVAMRKGVKKPITTEYACRLIFEKLKTLEEEGHPAVAVLNQSIENSWQGVFALKDRGNDMPAESEAITPVGLTEFFNAYPASRRCDLLEAGKLWREIGLDTPDWPAVVEALEAWKASEDWQKNDGQYIPGMARFLRERRHEAPPLVKRGYEFDSRKVKNESTVSEI